METNFTCPRCGDHYRRCYPALSRVDNKTSVCSDCGTEEALEDYWGDGDRRSWVVQEG